jgi:hypothetical protein
MSEAAATRNGRMRISRGYAAQAAVTSDRLSKFEPHQRSASCLPLNRR